jgi:hypothetical protein
MNRVAPMSINIVRISTTGLPKGPRLASGGMYLGTTSLRVASSAPAIHLDAQRMAGAECRVNARACAAGRLMIRLLLVPRSRWVTCMHAHATLFAGEQLHCTGGRAAVDPVGLLAAATAKGPDA